jgi:hypothetical protein
LTASGFRFQCFTLADFRTPQKRSSNLKIRQKNAPILFNKKLLPFFYKKQLDLQQTCFVLQQTCTFLTKTASFFYKKQLDLQQTCFVLQQTCTFLTKTASFFYKKSRVALLNAESGTCNSLESRAAE